MEDKGSPGIQAIYEACNDLYADQPIPPQVTALQKFWLGGPDPLDFISMYQNSGYDSSPDDEFASSPSHWHYVTYGLSDLYGDSRLHDHPSNEGPSGFGFELTFRLKRNEEVKAPLWPAMLMQSLARYLFRSQAKFAPGDHIPWDRSLEDIGNVAANDESMCNSRITNMVIATDPQLQRINSKHGYIDFLQVVGICDEEMLLARRWSGIEMTNAMRRRPETGGKLLVSDMRRGESLTDLEGNLSVPGGSNLSGVTTEVAWSCWGSSGAVSDPVGEDDCLPIRNASAAVSSQTPFYGVNMSPGTMELLHPNFIENIHLRISRDAGEIMHSVITDRLKFQRHFTFLHCRSDMAVTLVTENITGTFVSEDRPFGFRGPWLQVFINKELLDEMEVDFSNLTKIESQQLPVFLRFAKHKLLISIHSSSHLESDQSPLDDEPVAFLHE